jgi:peptide/nickel transport system permease protein
MTSIPDIAPVPTGSEPATRSLFRRLLRNPVGLVAMTYLVLLALASAFSRVLAPADPNAASLNDVLAPPGGAHPFGADSAGRDVLSRLLVAGQFSLAGALVALLVAMVIGVTTGLLAGFYGGRLDTVLSWQAGLWMALPGIIILLAARAVLGPSMWLSMAIFGLLLSPSFFRLVYASVTAVRKELYVDAAVVSGLTDRRIIARHILVAVRAPVIIQAAMVGGIAIAIQAGLEFLGLGDMTIPTWGSMLNDGFANIYTAPVLMLWPSLVIALTTISLTLLANAMRDELERTAGRRRRKRPAPATVDTTEHEAPVRHGDPDREREPLLAVTGLSVGHDQPDGSVTTVVQDVSLTVGPGEVHGLIGESGSGKTQTAWSILRLLPDSGRITGGAIVFDGTDLATLPAQTMQRLRGARIAYIPQEPMSNLDPSFTVGSQLTEPIRYLLRLSKAQARERALELLAKVGIPNPARTFRAYPHEISGGMAQRVLIAGAVSCEPDLLIADEPTTALDVTVQAEVLDLLRALREEMGMGILLVTHNFGVVADLCDRVSVMREGRVVESGPVRTILRDPRHEYTRSLLAAIPDESAVREPLPEAVTA